MPETPARDLVIRRARALGGDGRFRTLTLIVRDGRIAYAGPDDSAPLAGHAGVRQMAADDCTLLPGLTDCHAHLLSYGDSLLKLDLRRVPDFRTLVDLTAAQAARQPRGSWVQGRGWESSLWGGDQAVDLDRLSQAVPDHPVFLNRHDGHAAIVNRAALRAAGVDESTSDPAGGRLGRTKSGRSLTGLLVEAAARLATDRIPPLTAAERRARIALAGQHCLQFGITGVFDALDEPPWQDDIAALLAAGAPLPRVHGMWRVRDGDDAGQLAATRLTGPDPRGRLSVRRLRMVLDGGMGARGARMHAPYLDDEGTRGFLMLDPARVAEVSRAALAAGGSMCVHAIGDEAIDLLLDVWEPLLAGMDPARHRFMIEHCVAPTDAAVQRLARLGVIASVQPLHAVNVAPWIEARLGPERAHRAYAFKRLADAGVPLAMGSDVPLATPDPRLAWKAGVTREFRRPDGQTATWLPAQRLALPALLDGYTRTAAWAAFREHDLGSLQTGMRADLALFAGHIAELPAGRWPDMAVRCTVLDGQVVHES